MAIFDYVINILEATTYSYIIVNYITLKKNINKFSFFIFFSILNFIITTYFNLTIGYEGYYLSFKTIILFISLCMIVKKSLLENCIEVLLLSLVISLAISTYIIFVLAATNLEIYMIYQPPLYYISCVACRVFHFMWGYILVKFQKKLGHMITEYNWIFLILLVIIYFGTISVENIMMGNNGINSNYAFMAEICFILEIIIILYFIYVTRRKYLMDLEKDKLLTIHSSVADQIEQFKQDQERISMLRHDMKNKLHVLDAYLEQGQIEKVKEEIQNDLEYIESLKAPVFSGNSGLDLLINSKLIKCKNKNILFSIQIDKSAVADIDDISYGILLGNALDNAIEHNRKENPFIEFSIMKSQNQVKIEIINPIDVASIESLETTKEEKLSHGYGTKSIRSVVEQAKGTVLFQSRDYLFTCTILLPLKANDSKAEKQLH